MSRSCSHLRNLPIVLWLILAPLPVLARDNEPHWFRINSAHFVVLTDATEKNAVETILRLEQMRAVCGQLLMRSRLTMPEPLEVIAFKTREEYADAAPAQAGQPISRSGFFLPGSDRNYIVLDLSDEQSWRAVARQFAALYMSYNYPPTQSWFDEGFADYFSSLRLNDQRAALGADTAGFSALLNTSPWLPISKLVATQPATETMSNVFQAESWMLMHYLIDQNKLTETGTYFGLVEIQKLPIDQAIQQAYGMSAAQLEHALKEYFGSIASRLQQPETAQLGTANSDGPVRQFPAPLLPDDVGTSRHDVPEAQAQALVAEMTLRLPEHRQQAISTLQNLIEQPKGETAIAHRALAWSALQNHDYQTASEDLAKASDLDRNDFWVRYYLALTPYEEARSKSAPLQHIANMMQDLHAVLDAYPDFAEAANMLAMTQMEGGGIHAAIATMKSAIPLSPRNQTYLLNMADIYLAGKQWDAATELLNRLKDSSDSHVATAARKDLDDLPTLRKYGVLPQGDSNAVWSSPLDSDTNTSNASSGKESPTTTPTPELDRRKTHSVQGKLVSVDCSQPPVAIVKIAVGARTMKLRTDNFKSLLLIGTDEFSCAWKSLPAVVNYKPGGKADGDLVSLEIH